MKRTVALVVIAAVVFTSVGCSTLSVAPGLTAGEAEVETNAIVDQAVAGIDESVIARVDEVRNDSYACYPPHADADLSILGWDTRRYIVLTDDAVPRDVLNEIIATFDESDWHVGEVEQYMGEAGSGQVLISTAGQPDQLRYGVEISASVKGDAPAAINISATSPCFETK